MVSTGKKFQALTEDESTDLSRWCDRGRPTIV
jgi:hypothetical protein